MAMQQYGKANLYSSSCGLSSRAAALFRIPETGGIWALQHLQSSCIMYSGKHIWCSALMIAATGAIFMDTVASTSSTSLHAIHIPDLLPPGSSCRCDSFMGAEDQGCAHHRCAYRMSFAHLGFILASIMHRFGKLQEFVAA